MIYLGVDIGGTGIKVGAVTEKCELLYKESAPTQASLGYEVLAKEKTEKALLAFLRPEFINRIDEIITFNSLSLSDFEKIADLMLSKLKEHLASKGTTLRYSDDVLKLIAEKSFSEKYGARNMRRFIERNVEDKIANVVIDNYSTHIEGIALAVKDGEITVSYI